MIGRTLSHYTVLREIGQGGMGIVYAALDRRLNREVALKVLPADLVSNPDRKARFVREAQATAALKHPNIAVVYEIDEADGTTFIAMELIEGEKLSSLLDDGPLPQARTLPLAIEIAEGLGKAHEKGIVHRDLKPGNVMLTEDGHPKIIDFGLAKLLEPTGSEDSELQTAVRQQTRSQVLLGTVSYMSPEQARGRTIDHRSDVFAFGILLYEMLSGRRPFEAPSAPEILNAIIHTAAPARPELPAGLWKVIDKCLAKSPDERYQTMAEVVAELTAVKQDLDSGVVLSTPRSRRIPAYGVAAGAGIAALAALLLWPRTEPSHGTAGAKTSLAVLFFENASGDPTLDWLRAGLTEMIVTQLERSPTLDVLSTDDLYEILRESGHLDAEALSLEVQQSVARSASADIVAAGSFMKAGNAIRIITRLRETGGDVLQTETVEGVGDESIFGLADEIGRRIRVRFETEPAGVGAVDHPTSNLEAFADYVQARNFLERPDAAGNLERAEGLFRSAVEKDPAFALAHAGLGRTYWARYEETLDPAWTARARDAVLEALRIEPDAAEVRLSLAVILDGSGRRAEAIEELRRAIAADPDDDDAQRELGMILAEEGRIDEAVTALSRAVSLRPSYWENHSKLGLIFYRSGRYPEAIDAFRRVTELQPDSATGFQTLGTVYQTIGELDRAIENYEKAIALGPSRGSYSNLGMIYYYQGKFAEAAEAFQKALDVGPEYPLHHRNLGDAYMRLGEREKARASYLRAVELSEEMLAVNPRDANVLASLAVYEAKLGRLEEAQRHAAEAAVLSPSDPDVLIELAVVHTFAGQSTEAFSALERALEHGYSERLAAENDDLIPLRALPGYDALMNENR